MDFTRANLKCQYMAELLLQHVDVLLSENRKNRKQFEKNVNVFGHLVSPLTSSKSSLSDCAAPYFKYRRDESNDQWTCLPSNGEAEMKLKQKGIGSLSFLNDHQPFCRIEKKKVQLAVMKEAITVKWNELHTKQQTADAEEIRSIRLEIERYSDLKNQMNGVDVEGHESDVDGESDWDGEQTDERDCRVTKCLSKSCVDKVLAKDPIFGQHEIISAIDWQNMWKSCILKTPRTSNHFKFCWNHVISPLTNTSAWGTEENRRLKEIVKDLQHPIDWDNVALELNTQRTAFACFSRYQVHLSTTHRQKGWSDEENERMVELIHAYQYRDLSDISWRKIKVHLEGRSKVQIYSHWKYHQKKPDKSPFTQYEDALIDVAFRMGFEFGPMSQLVFGGRRTTPQIRERCHKMMRYGMLDMNKWTSRQDKLIRDQFGQHHSKLRNAEMFKDFKDRSSAQLSMRYHYLKLKATKQMRKSKGLICKQLPEFCNRLSDLIDKYIPDRNDDGTAVDKLWDEFMKLCNMPIAQREEKQLGRPKKQPLTKKEELCQVLSPLFPINLHQTRKTSFPGDGRQNGLILMAASRLLNGDLETLETIARNEPDALQHRVIEDGIGQVNVLPLQNMIELRHEAASNAPGTGTNQQLLIPPTIHTIVGLRGLKLQKKTLDSAGRIENETGSSIREGLGRADTVLLSRLISLFFWPAVMSMTDMPESFFAGNISEIPVANDHFSEVKKRTLPAAKSKPEKKSKK